MVTYADEALCFNASSFVAICLGRVNLVLEKTARKVTTAERLSRASRLV